MAKQDQGLTRLSPEAQAVVAAKTIRARKTVKEWQRLFAELGRFDANTDARMARIKKVGCAYGVIAFLSIFVGVLLTAFLSPLLPGKLAALPALAFLAPPVLGAIGVYYYFQYKKVKSFDLMNDFRLALWPVLEIMAEDLTDKGKVQLALDLRGLTPEKVLSHQEAPPGRFKKVLRTVYQDFWCQLSMELADGNVISLTIKNFFEKMERHWTNPRGKSKSKSKWRKLVVVSARVLPQGQDFKWDEARLMTVPPQAKLKLQDKKGVRVLRQVKKFKFKAVNQEPPDVAPPQEIVGMFVQLYSLLLPSETRS